MPNPYLARQREQYEALRSAIEGLQTRAAEADRDLTDQERQTVKAQTEQAQALFTEIETLSEFENRSAKVDQLDSALIRNAKRAKDAAKADRSVDRDEVYTRSKPYSFFGDLFQAQHRGNKEAAARIAAHESLCRESEVYTRGVTSSTGAGMVAPIWLADAFAPNLHRRLRVASVLRQIPFAGPTAWTLGVAGTNADTQAQAVEGTNPTESNPTASVITVTPTAIGGFTDVSRQLLEGSNPAADAVLWGDMIGDFYDDAEAVVITALTGQASVNTVTIADGAVLPGARNGVLDAIAAVGDNNGGDPDTFAGRTSRWTQYLKLTDTTNRPLIVSQRYDAVNVNGRGDATQGFRSPVQGSIEGLAAVTSPTIAANTAFVLNSQEILFSLSEPSQFTYEQVVGPAEVRVGVWGYCSVITGRRPKAITKITYTAN